MTKGNVNFRRSIFTSKKETDKEKPYCRNRKPFTYCQSQHT